MIHGPWMSVRHIVRDSHNIVWNTQRWAGEVLDLEQLRLSQMHSQCSQSVVCSLDPQHSTLLERDKVPAEIWPTCCFCESLRFFAISCVSVNFMYIWWKAQFSQCTMCLPHYHRLLKELPRVRIELTTFRLWDWRAAYCANKACKRAIMTDISCHNYICQFVWFFFHMSAWWANKAVRSLITCSVVSKSIYLDSLLLIFQQQLMKQS